VKVIIRHNRVRREGKAEQSEGEFHFLAITSKVWQRLLEAPL
jgi:hypothetical protein